MKKEVKETILYSNDIDSYDFDEVKAIIEEERRLDKDDTPVTDEDVYNQIYFYQDCDCQDYEDAYKEIINRRRYVVLADLGRWNGRAKAKKFIGGWNYYKKCFNGWNEFLSRFSHLDYITIKDVNGRLIVEGSHHDGHDKMEFRELTEKGKDLADNPYRWYKDEAYLCNIYSKYPRLLQYVSH